MSNNLLSKGLIFFAGGLIGSIGTWILIKTKYEQTIEDKNEEIIFLRNRYSCTKNGDDINKGDQKEIEKPDDISVQKIRDKVQELGYINDQIMNERDDTKNMNRPYPIKPEETWEQDYPTITLTFYEKDNVLADEKDKIIKNIDELVGADFASHFGEYEDDCVYIRNDELEVYYEILKDNGSYHEVFR